METVQIQGASLITIIRLDEAEKSGGANKPTADNSPEATTAPVPVNILVDLEPGITVHKEPDLGDIPFVVIGSGRTKINFGVNAGQASELTKDHLALVDQLAEAFCWLRDQVRDVAPGQARS